MVIDLDHHRLERLRQRQRIDRLAEQLNELARASNISLEPRMKNRWKRLLAALLLALPLMANAVTHSVWLATYTPADATWYLRCAVGTNTKAVVGSALVTQRIVFQLGAPGDDVKCETWTAKGADSSQVSAEQTKHIPFPLAAPAILTWDLLP